MIYFFRIKESSLIAQGEGSLDVIASSTDSLSVLNYSVHVYLYLFPTENWIGVKRLDFKVIS